MRRPCSLRRSSAERPLPARLALCAGVGLPPWEILATALPPTDGFFAGFLDGARTPGALCLTAPPHLAAKPAWHIYAETPCGART